MVNGFYSFTETGRGECSLLEQVRNTVRGEVRLSELDKPLAREVAVCGADGADRQRDRLSGMLDSPNMTGEYRKVLTERIENMDQRIRPLFERYGGRLVCLDADFPGTAYFSGQEEGFRVDGASDLKNPCGAGSTFFHESAHMIDWLMGKEAGREYATGDAAFVSALEADLKDALTGIMRSENCTWEEAQDRLSMELLSAPYASACVSDVFGGLTGNRVCGAMGHSREYWAVRGRDAVAREAFAEITEQMICNPEGLAFTEKMMPRTFERYLQMVADAGR